MLSIDAKTIERTAELSNLHIADEEKGMYAAQLSEILSYVEKINKLDTSEVQPTDHIAAISNIFRADIILPSIDVESIRSFAPEFDRGHIVVPKIIEGEA
jgi:aspartyl-tRNA(Asn)/glutamyl-tRNA(Gln) amidotransferase subunit C